MPEMELSYGVDSVRASNLLRFSSTKRIRKQEGETDALTRTDSRLHILTRHLSRHGSFDVSMARMTFLERVQLLKESNNS